jgi:hypothetical protein
MNTTNYNLYLEDDSTTRFLDWRQKMNGSDNSNMVKIDNALAEKAALSRAITATLFANQWNTDGAVSTQTITIDGLTPEQNGVIGTAQNLTGLQIETVRAAGLYISSQGDGYLTIASDGETPSCDIPVLIILLG